MVYINENLVFLRKKNGFTQSEVSNLIPVKVRTYSAWEEKRSTPPLNYLPILSQLYNVPVALFIYTDLSSSKTPIAKDTPAATLYKSYITSPKFIKDAIDTLLKK